jgi:hypothetical protein
MEEADQLTGLLKNSFHDLLKTVSPVSDSTEHALALIGTPGYNYRAGRHLFDYLESVKPEYQKRYEAATAGLEQAYQQFLNRFNGNDDELLEFKNKHVNKKLELLVRDKYSPHKMYIFNDRIYQGDEPIFRRPVHQNGRAHFYAARKYVGKLKIEAPLFNIIMMWLFTGFLMIALYFDLLRKIINYVERWRLTRQAELRDRIFYNPMAFMKGERKKN